MLRCCISNSPQRWRSQYLSQYCHYQIIFIVYYYLLLFIIVTVIVIIIIIIIIIIIVVVVVVVVIRRLRELIKRKGRSLVISRIS